MNNCDLCGKEGIAEFTVKSKHLRWVLSEDLQKLDTHKNSWLTKDICEDCFKKIFGKPEESHIIEQNTGENGIESDVLNISGSVSENQYRPFKDTAELISHYEKHFNVDYPSFYEPLIWVKAKDDDSRIFITGFNEYYVQIHTIETRWISMKELFENYVFLDNNPCGKKEE